MTSRSLALLGRIALADLRQRTRTPRVLFVPVLVVFLAHTLTAGSVVLLVGEGFVGEPNAAWIGTITAFTGTIVTFLAGGLLIGGNVARDSRLGVDVFVATSPMDGRLYVLGKWLSNLVVLLVVATLLALSAAGTFLVRGTGAFGWELLLPFVLFTLPTFVVVATVALLLDLRAETRDTAGAVLYTVFAGAWLIGAAIGRPYVPDPFGFRAIRESFHAALGVPIGPGFEFAPSSQAVVTFTWRGLRPSVGAVLERALLALAALCVLWIATELYTRRRRSTGGWTIASSPEREEPSLSDTAVESSTAEDSSEPQIADVEPLRPVRAAGTVLAFRQLVRVEFRLLAHRRRFLLAASATAVLGLLVSPSVAMEYLFPVALLAPLGVCASLANRSRRYGLRPLLQTVPHPFLHLAATWIVGAAAVGLTVSGVVVTVGLAERVVPITVLLPIVWLPSLALAIARWNGSRRLFEGIALALWYLGPVNRGGIFAGPTGLMETMPYALASLVLLLVVVAGQYRWSKPAPS